MNKNINIIIFLVVVAIIIVFVFAYCGRIGRDTRTEIIEEAKEEPAQEKAIQGSKESPRPPMLFITVGVVQWKILNAEDLGNTLEPVDDYHDIKTTNGRFIKVRFQVKNKGSEMVTLTSLKLFDDKDREFTDYSETSGYIEDEEELFLLDNINPGMEETYTLIYEVPKDANNLMLEVTSLEFTGDKEYISLDFDYFK
jgi:hypothetical protein